MAVRSENPTACGTAGHPFQPHAQQRGGQDGKPRLEKPHKGVIELRMVYRRGFFIGKGCVSGVIYCTGRREPKSGSFIPSFVPSPVTDTQGTCLRTTPLGSAVQTPICFPFSNPRAFGPEAGRR